MPREDHLEFDAVVEEASGGGKYRCKVTDAAAGNGMVIVAQLNGRMKRNHIRVIPGDKVRVAVSPYDTTNGFIVFRSKQ